MPASSASPIALSPRAARDFPFAASDFRRVRELIYAHAGIALAESKEEMVYSRLSRRLRAKGFATFTQYLDHLEAPGNEAEWEHFTNALTTNLTAFFREAHHFPMLAEHLQACARTVRDRPLRIWSCAASTGEEPYSIAITAAEALASPSTARILATDVDTRVLETARAGVYDAQRVQDIAPELLRKYFQRGSGAHAGQVRVQPQLSAMLQFRPLNLLADDWQSLKPFDAIFCRNVMIYFDKPTQYTLLKKLKALLEPHGLLFAGHSESLSFASDLLRLRSQTVYERADAPRPPHSPRSPRSQATRSPRSEAA